MPRSSTYIYMATLSVTDSLVQVTNILFLVSKFPGHEVMVKGTCGLIFFLLYFSLHSNVVVMITMTAERYLAIRFPLKAMRWFTARRAKQAVAGVLLLTLLLNAHHLVIRRMTWNDYLKEDTCTLTGSSQQIHTYGLVWPWIDGSIYCFIPFISLVVFNVLIVKHMRQSRKFRWSNTRQSSDHSTRQGDPNRQITMMLLMVTCAFLVLVGPVATMLLVERYLWIRTSPREKAVYHLVRTILNNLSYTNHAINFLLYCLSGNRFRQEFIQLFCTRSSCRSSREEQQQRRENSLNADRTSPLVSLTHSLTSYTFTDQSVPSLNGGTPGTFSHI
ncbi:probable G-protein coupled receptor B0563.6 [Littorina saxatilis]